MVAKWASSVRFEALERQFGVELRPSTIKPLAFRLEGR